MENSEAEVNKPEQMEPLTVDVQAHKQIAGNSSIVLGMVTPHNVLQLKKLNEAVFPIVYNDKFYTEVRYAGELAKLVYYNDVVVGAVCCRYDITLGERSLYIMTLGTLAAYRQYGIGTIMINHVFKLCEQDKSIKIACLHVQSNNQTALDFYKKHGFEDKGLVENYYRIQPCGAYLLVKRIRD